MQKFLLTIACLFAVSAAQAQQAPRVPDARQGAGVMEPYSDADNPDRIFIWEKWATRADQESYLQWRLDIGFVEALAPVLAEPPRIIHLSAAE